MTGKACGQALRRTGRRLFFLYHNGEILTECDGESAPVRRYLTGLGLSHVQTEDGVYHAYHQDEQGNTAYITGQGVENCYQYDAFGNLTERNETFKNRILYTGQQYDQETGQYYLRARHYNPVVGRFLQEDTYRGDGLNLYAYCANNPVNYFDDGGDSKKKIIQGALGGAYENVAANGGEVHHMPANSISPYSTGKGPGIRMEKGDHMETASWGSSKAAVEYREKQRQLIDEGKFKEAQQMDIEDVREKFGDKYDKAIEEMQAYTDELLEESSNETAHSSNGKCGK